ncbi:MAG: TonB-dependent receptor [Xanthomonadales bacterium]|nr:TonB-dependent receptor [Xanthomonadales bacterium]
MLSSLSLRALPTACRVGCGWIAVLCPLAAQAQLPTEPETVVTATRTPLAIAETLSTVDLIRREDIDAAGSADLVDLLRQRAGIDIIRSGGLGGQTSVFLRGAGSNQLLVLIDGVRVASANTGGYAWEHLALDQVERIEIVRGPRAALYGSDAIGGVIQIFTRRDGGASGSLRVGSERTYGGTFAFGSRGERGGFGARVSLLDTEGFNAQNADGFAFDPDRDGATQRNALAWFELGSDALAFEGSIERADDDVEFDQGESSVQATAVQARLSGNRFGDWQLQASGNREDTETPAFFARFESRLRQLDWQQAIGFGSATSLLWGLTAADQDGRSIDTFSGTDAYGDDRELIAGFAALRGDGDHLDWEFALRRDDYSGFDGATTAQLAVGWQLADTLALRANGGDGFRAPNLNELFSPGFGGGLFAGNPDLAPERSRNWELALDHRVGDAFSHGVRLYQNRVRDLVDFSGGETFQAINIGRSRLRGLEWEAQGRMGIWSWRGNLGWQQAVNLDSGADLLRRAPRKANLAVEQERGRWRWGADLHAVAARPEFGGALPGYALLNLHARGEFSAHVGWSLRLENLFDRDYALARGFNAPGAAVQAQLHWTP